MAVNGATRSAQQISDLNTLPIPAAIRWSRSAVASSVPGSQREPGQHRVEIDFGCAEVRAEAFEHPGRARRAVVAVVLAPQLDDRRCEADRGGPVGDPHHDARGVPGPAPTLGRSVQVPRAGHLHVRVEHVTVREVHEDVLAHRVDTRDRRARLRSSSTSRISPHLEVDEPLPDERDAQLGRGAKDRVTFGHGHHRARAWRSPRPVRP